MTHPLLPVVAPVSPSGRSTRGSHQLAAALTCERLWWLRYDKHLVPRGEKSTLLMGTLIHLALAYYYASKLPQPPEWFLQADLHTALLARSGNDERQVQQTKEILVGYIQYYETENWKPRYIETEFSAAVGALDPGGPDASLDNEVITCRPDIIVEIDGLNWIVDYKSAGPAWGKNKDKLEGWSTENEFALHWQILMNLHIVRQHMPIEGFIIQRLKRSPPYDYDRSVVRIPKRAYAQAPRVARAAAAREREIKARTLAGIPPLPCFWACYGRYGPCDYRAVCKADTTEDQQAIMADKYTTEAR